MAFAFDPLSEGIQRCPFLHRLAATEGEPFARNFATNPLRSAQESCVRKPVFEELEDFSHSFQVFHGPQGLVPLHNKHSRGGELATTILDTATRKGDSTNQTRKPSAHLAPPAASLSLANFDFWKGLGNIFKKQDKKQKKPRNSRARGHRGQASTTTSAKSLKLGVVKAPESGGGECPLRKCFGPLGAMIISGQYKCPPAIVQMRAMLSRTQVVKSLRPESLPVKILAVMAISASMNLPFGALREHCRKFSPEWFLMVHATIPLIAMFRKSVIMPKYAILFTVAAAVGGQMVGARLERLRVKGASNGIHSSHKSKQECTNYSGPEGPGALDSNTLIHSPQFSFDKSNINFVKSNIITPVA